MKWNFPMKIVKLFDPLGFVTPFVVRAKVLLHEILFFGWDCDHIFQEDLTIKARKRFSELEDLPTIKFPRCLRSGQEEEM